MKEEFVKASHNSGTGEPSARVIDKLLIPFARCQSKTIAEQFLDGVRLFDIRVDNEFRISHGCWKSKTMFQSVLQLINIYNKYEEPVHFIVTFEGKPSAKEEGLFYDTFTSFLERNASNGQYNWFYLDSLNVKKPTWRSIWDAGTNVWIYKQCYTKLVGWKALLPIPWIWKQIEKFDTSDGICMQDFI